MAAYLFKVHFDFIDRKTQYYSQNLIFYNNFLLYDKKENNWHGHFPKNYFDCK